MEKSAVQPLISGSRKDSFDATRGTIYVVDDDAFVLDSIKLLLKCAGWAVETFPSAEACLTALETSQPTCVLCDLIMPTMNGAEFVDALRSRQCPVPVIVQTALPESPLAARAKANGAKAVLEKPISAKSVDTTLAQISSIAASSSRL